MVKFGINTFLWTSPFTTENLDLVKKGRAFGFDVVEIPVEGDAEIDEHRLSEAFKRAGVGCSICAVMGAGRDPSDPDPDAQTRALEYLTRCIDIAAAVGSGMVAGPLYAPVGRQWQATPEERQRDLERCAGNLRKAARYAEEHGIVLAIEPINRFETSFINLTDQALELMRMIDRPNVKVMMDTFHANIEEKAIGSAIEAAGKDLVHLHANENDRGIPGTGHLPWGEIADALERIEYDGTLVIESFSTEVKEIARAAAVWRPLAPSPDELARQGLAFLKQTFGRMSASSG